MKVCTLGSDFALVHAISSSFLVSTHHILPMWKTRENKSFVFYVMESKCRLFNLNVKNEMIGKFSKKTVLLKLLYHWTKPFNDLHYFWVVYPN
jgi:hypothetical protein